MTTEQITLITIVGGGILAFVFEYAPAISPRFDRLSSKQKKLVAVLLSVVIAFIIMLLSCNNLLSVGCPSQANVIDWILVACGAILGNQATYSLQR